MQFYTWDGACSYGQSNGTYWFRTRRQGVWGEDREMTRDVSIEYDDEFERHVVNFSGDDQQLMSEIGRAHV